MSRKETKIITAGFGGQGIVVVGNVIARACVIEDKNVTGMVSYGAEMRGGTANATVIVSDEEIASPYVVKPDIGIFLNQPSVDRFEKFIEKGGWILANTSMIQRLPVRDDLEKIFVPATEIAHEMGNLRVSNIVALGAFIEHTKLLKMSSIEEGLRELFGAKNPKIVDLNIKALYAGAKRSHYESSLSNTSG